MKNLKNIEEMESVINKNEMALIYIWGNSCNVCHALKAKIEEVIKEYPNIQCYDVELDKVKEIQSRFSVFTQKFSTKIPVKILFLLELYFFTLT